MWVMDHDGHDISEVKFKLYFKRIFPSLNHHICNILIEFMAADDYSDWFFEDSIILALFCQYSFLNTGFF